MSYITRLREQSGLAIVNEPVAKRPNVSVPAAVSASPAIELIEVDETREVASEGVSPAVDIVSLSPASASRGKAESTHKHYVEPVADLAAPRPDSGETARSAPRASKSPISRVLPPRRVGLDPIRALYPTLRWSWRIPAGT